ncbi:MAG: endolytic transglycosylase MltG [Spirochaetaceae bacterium]
MSKLLKITAAVLLTAVLLAAGIATALFLYNRPSESIPSDGAVLHIEGGRSLSSVSMELEERGLIHSRYLLMAISRIQKADSTIKNGYYHIKPGMSTTDILDLIVEGKQTLHKVSIPEGFTAAKIAVRLEDAGVCGEEEFLEVAVENRNNWIEEELSDRYRIPEDVETLEGFLYPDTYLFQQGYPAKKVVTHMVRTFFEKLEEVEPDYKEYTPEELYEKVTIASIVEREYRSAEEASKIASVFYNRIERGMQLQSCATVVYALTEEEGREHPERLSYADLEIDSEFNTYKTGGLPPSPIAAPGRVALDAAFHPEETDYLFFLLKNPEDGSHTFTRNLSEHNEAYRLYIKQ